MGPKQALVAVIPTFRGEQPTPIWGTARDDRLFPLAKDPYLHPSSTLTDNTASRNLFGLDLLGFACATVCEWPELSSAREADQGEGLNTTSGMAYLQRAFDHRYRHEQHAVT
jgi:hypothetical protein